MTRDFHITEIEDELIRTEALPRGGKVLTVRDKTVVVWEYASGGLWLVVQRGVIRPGFFRRLIGDKDVEAVIVTALRQHPSLQVLEDFLE